jgi:hypothetical protein
MLWPERDMGDVVPLVAFGPLRQLMTLGACRQLMPEMFGHGRSSRGSIGHFVSPWHNTRPGLLISAFLTLMLSNARPPLQYSMPHGPPSICTSSLPESHAMSHSWRMTHGQSLLGHSVPVVFRSIGHRGKDL